MLFCDARIGMTGRFAIALQNGHCFWGEGVRKLTAMDRNADYQEMVYMLQGLIIAGIVVAYIFRFTFCIKFFRIPILGTER